MSIWIFNTSSLISIINFLWIFTLMRGFGSFECSMIWIYSFFLFNFDKLLKMWDCCAICISVDWFQEGSLIILGCFWKRNFWSFHWFHHFLFLPFAIILLTISSLQNKCVTWNLKLFAIINSRWAFLAHIFLFFAF